MTKRKMNWEITESNGHLYVNLNGGINRILDINHRQFADNKKELVEEIEFFKTFTRTTITGAELIS